MIPQDHIDESVMYLIKDNMNDFKQDVIEFSEGDWLRFYRMNELVIAEVRYLRRDKKGHLVASTNRGEIDTRDVLEVRRLAEYVRGDD